MRNKPMIYDSDGKMEFIAIGLYDGFKYYVKNNGTHPCCYVMIPDDCYIILEKHKKYLENNISCHGGLTYIEEFLWDNDAKMYLDGSFIGWDYAHLCDFVAGQNGHNGIKYTTDFLVNECMSVIEQLQDIENYIKNPNPIKVIAVDFDGVLCSNKYPDVGEPNWDIIDEAVKQKNNGTKLVLWTCRCDEDLDRAVEACSDWGLHFDAVNDNIEELQLIFGNNTRKVFANEYWDDHNKTLDEIRKQHTWEEEELDAE